ncbi:MAG: DUF6064 family protein [Gammaproteobacteria bacterium]|nr:DUF6064 family protein [Gammaproteobacteria bacterium]
MLPFTTEVFFSVFEQYNLDIWPAQLVAYVLGLAMLVHVFKPIRHGDRLVSAALAAAWLWNGLVYHLAYFATINFAAPAFAALFVVQGALLVWTGVVRGRTVWRFRADAYGWIGLALAVFAMALYPLIGWLAGHGWPSSPLLGVAPCPTTIFTVGMLLLSAQRTPLHLVIIPVLWSLVGGSAAWLLGVVEDVALPIAGIGGAALIVVRNRRHFAAAPT